MDTSTTSLTNSGFGLSPWGSFAPGLEGKDASFISALHGQGAHRDVGLGVVRNRVETVENKFQAGCDVRDAEIRMERLERENQQALASMKAEILAEIRASDAKRTEHELADAKTELMIRRIVKELTPTPKA